MFRPFVQISLAAADRNTAVLGLIDTGADAILASDLLADQLDLDLEHHDGETAHAVGGRTMTARYKTIELRLHPTDPTASHYLEWQAQVGFIGGWHSYSFVLLPVQRRGVELRFTNTTAVQLRVTHTHTTSLSGDRGCLLPLAIVSNMQRTFERPRTLGAPLRCAVMVETALRAGGGLDKPRKGRSDAAEHLYRPCLRV